jgi:phosphoribosylaminoimidazolecarboxamide formyltransferase/IMP cyclohydrolase
MNVVPIRRAMVSVSDKSGLADFAQVLHRLDVELLSTGGTAAYLRDHGFPVTDVAQYTGFPEMLGGRVKTLHPKVFAGILARRQISEDLEAIAQFDIAPLDLVVVNLYPFEATASRPGAQWDEVIEQIDIGGPSLVRAAAKNYVDVAVATSPQQYAAIADQLEGHQGTTLELREQLASEAFAHTARYDGAISGFFARRLGDAAAFPPVINLSLRRQATLRYGENPHQQAALYRRASDLPRGANLLDARQLHGKELSYNNLLDLDAALAIARDLPDMGVAVLKHNNPCGAASALSLIDACRKAMEGDPISAFGSILGFNQIVDEATADYLSDPGLFVEAIVAPGFSESARQILTTRPKWRSSVRLVEVGPLADPPSGPAFRHIEGGMLVQTPDNQPDDPSQWQVVTEHHPTETQMAELQFAWRVVRHVKSNAIVLSRDRAVCGVGAGQMSRVDSVDISIRKAGDRTRGAALASDAFFPFPDSIHHAADAGIVAVVQPGGSRRDDEVIAACNQRRLPMVFTGRRHFRH